MEKPVVMITGASSGIGEALAREFAAQGAHLVLLARRKDRLERLQAELSGDGKKVMALSCDVTRDGDLEKAVATTLQEFSRIDVVIANAGFTVIGKVERLQLEDFRRQFETNIFGVLRTVKATIEPLKKTQGRIGIIGSVMGHISLPGTTAYTMSKFAVRSLAEGMSLELRPYGISVTHISPGFIASEIRSIDNKGLFRPERKETIPPWLLMPAPKAARQIARAVMKRKHEKTITFYGKLTVILVRLFPNMMRWVGAQASPRSREGVKLI